MVEYVGKLVYIFNRRPIVFKKLVLFLTTRGYLGTKTSQNLEDKTGLKVSFM